MKLIPTLKKAGKKVKKVRTGRSIKELEKKNKANEKLINQFIEANKAQKKPDESNSQFISKSIVEDLIRWAVEVSHKS